MCEGANEIQSPAQPLKVDRSVIRPWSTEEISQFLHHRRNDIRRIGSERLKGMRGRFEDSEDVYSSVCLRMIKMAHAAKLRPRGDEEVWALASKIAENTAISKVRVLKRIQTELAEDEASDLSRFFSVCESDEEATLMLHRLAQRLESGEDRQLLVLRLRGMSHEMIARSLSINPAAARQRWTALMKRLRAIPLVELLDDE
jgi:DNA-directed RNA polymerase specialized sigma24 family protein